QDVVKAAAVAYFGGRDQISILSSVQGLLDRKVPFTNKTLGEFLIRNDALRLALFGANPGITSTMTYDQIAARLKTAGIKIDANPATGSDAMARLTRGERVSLLSNQLSGSKTLASTKFDFPIGMIGIPWLINGSLGVEVEPSLSLTYQLNTGIDTAGFY